MPSGFEQNAAAASSVQHQAAALPANESVSSAVIGSCLRPEGLASSADPTNTVHAAHHATVSLTASPSVDTARANVQHVSSQLMPFVSAVKAPPAAPVSMHTATSSSLSATDSVGACHNLPAAAPQPSAVSVLHTTAHDSTDDSAGNDEAAGYDSDCAIQDDVLGESYSLDGENCHNDNFEFEMMT